LKPPLQQVGTIIEYREVYDRPASLPELISLIRDLDAVDSLTLLCQMSADFRLVRRDRDSIARIQQDVAGGCLATRQLHGLKNASDRLTCLIDRHFTRPKF
jgi:hypothetical protein